jgi:Holliday junction resolvase-like predicted endonuclease
MTVNHEELSSNLEILFQTENRIAEIVKKSGLRFSTNKMTADLGEFYAYTALTNQKSLFESIEAQVNSNAEFDLIGKLTSNSILLDMFKKDVIRIEVKTRRNQEGAKYLSSLKPEKFELLCVVDMAKNYTLNKIYLVKSETAIEFLDTKYQRLIFKESMSFMTIEEI